MRSYASVAAAMIAWPPSGVATDSALATASPPAARISSTTACATPVSRSCPLMALPVSLTTTLAPRAASSSA